MPEEDREVAKAALAERLLRKHPTRPTPRWFDAGDVALVAACSTAIEGDRDAKLQAHRQALDGARLVSKDGPPTVRFVWGKLEHFLDHLERGRAREAKLRERSPPRPAVVSTQASVSPAQVSADIERLFGAFGQTKDRRTL